jgi:subtilisin family serine protease
LDESPALQARRHELLQTVEGRHSVVVEMNLGPTASASTVSERFLELFDHTFAKATDKPPAPEKVSGYWRCRLTPLETKQLLVADESGSKTRPAPHSIFRVWPDYILRPHLDSSTSTINADAARRVYNASGGGIVWGVVDSGVDASHAHFASGTFSDPRVADLHRDFTYMVRGEAAPATPDPTVALSDPVGHGTHVAGIIAGGLGPDVEAVIATSRPTVDNLPNWVARSSQETAGLTGVAPHARLVSLRVLDAGLDGDAVTTSSAVIQALAWVREVNADGRALRIHGVNLSLGCPWFPDDYAAGQSPLCREIDLLVGTGVVVVVSAGNGGASGTLTGGSSDVSGALSTITDPGNAEKAITVGSSHKDSPHAYGVSFTSSKGPTLDGRLKPDVVAPGEHIASAAAPAFCSGIEPLGSLTKKQAPYREESGTSMAAPHVSGAIAAFLSVRAEYIGRPEEVKQLFVANASSLKRHVFFQGAGLVDLMRVFGNL